MSSANLDAYHTRMLAINSRSDARTYLQRQYAAEVLLFPRLRDTVSEALYVRRNLPYVLRNAKAARAAIAKATEGQS